MMMMFTSTFKEEAGSKKQELGNFLLIPLSFLCLLDDAKPVLSFSSGAH
jgi:hypothetical protein